MNSASVILLTFSLSQTLSHFWKGLIMFKGLRNFIIASSILTILFFAVIVRWYMEDTSRIWLMVIGFALYALSESYVIRRFSGATPNPATRKKFGISRESEVYSHNQLNLLKKYGLISSFILLVVGALYIAIEHPAQWPKQIGWIIVGAPIMSLIDYIENKRTIKGYRKKEIFK